MGVARRDELVGFGVVERKVVDVDLESAVLLEQSKAGGDDVEVLQAEEVDLQQADVADGFHVVLRHHRLSSRAVLERREVHQRLRRDDHAGSVSAHVARDAFESPGDVD